MSENKKESAVLDSKLARGYARQLGRAMAKDGPDLRLSTISFAHAVAVKSADGTKITPESFNVAVVGLQKKANACPANIMFEIERATRHRDGGFRCLTLVRREFTRLRGSGADFAAKEWGMGYEEVTLSGGFPTYTLGDSAVLIDDHLVERFFERTGSADTLALRSALGKGIKLAVMQTNLAVCDGLGLNNLVIPAPDGVFLGDVEPIRTSSLGRILYHLRRGKRDLEYNSLDEPSDVIGAGSIRTYVCADMLSARQTSALARLNRWYADHPGLADGDIAGQRTLFAEVGDELASAFGKRAKSLENRRPYTLKDIEAMAAASPRKHGKGSYIDQLSAMSGISAADLMAPMRGLGGRRSGGILNSLKGPSTASISSHPAQEILGVAPIGMSR